jgi:hypothetical protein
MLIWGGSVIAMTMLLAASGLDIATRFQPSPASAYRPRIESGWAGISSRAERFQTWYAVQC